MPPYDGGPAFPVGNIGAASMTLRDYFAAQAMQAFLSKAACVTSEQTVVVATGAGQLAGMAYLVADAMLEQRSKN